MGKCANYVPLSGGMSMQFGEWAFVSSSTTVELPTKLQTIISTITTPEAYSGGVASGGHVMFCDKTITTGAVTVARKANVDSALKFSYVFIGSYGSVGGSDGVTA